ncbi:MAG: translation elongation factor Ts, partial [Candidatus Cloacimonetes bacterium]|nr:translation elongation factor Ts [Candidatus Cloacimonadota bacterium]
GNGKIGVMVEISCETDFVAKNEKFIELCKNIAMHIAASNPMAISEEDLNPRLIESEKEIYKNRALNEGKPEKIIDRIVDGQIKKFKQQNCLLNQEFIKDPEKTINDIMNDAVVTLGENLKISKFVRYSIG